jgi:hypothetical protein
LSSESFEKLADDEGECCAVLEGGHFEGKG